jgi:hypothetical protein
MASQHKPPRYVSLLSLVLDTGERLPVLVDTDTWEPKRVATRWALTYRRHHVQSSTLTSNLQVIRCIYEWAWTIAGFDLDEHLVSGKLLSTRQIESLAAYLREGDLQRKCRDRDDGKLHVLNSATYDNQGWFTYPVSTSRAICGFSSPTAEKKSVAPKSCISMPARSIALVP